MDANYVLKAVFSYVPPLQVSLSPLLTATSEEVPISFVATAHGGMGRKMYVWYLNNTVVAVHDFRAGSDSWGFVPQASGTYYVFVKVTSEWSAGDIVESEIAKVTFTPPPPLSASISPLSASVLVGHFVTFTSTVSGGYAPYSYQWYLNGYPASDTNATSWTFTSRTADTYSVYLRVTDAEGNTVQSETARIVSPAVGGYSISTLVPTKAETILLYIALTATLTAIFTGLNPKSRRKR